MSALISTDKAVHAALPHAFVKTGDPGTIIWAGSGEGSFTIGVPFSIKNYGTTPALIKSVEAETDV